LLPASRHRQPGQPSDRSDSHCEPDKAIRETMLCKASERVRFAISIASGTQSRRSTRMTTSADPEFVREQQRADRASHLQIIRMCS
jgi:hypothetical protein